MLPAVFYLLSIPREGDYAGSIFFGLALSAPFIYAINRENCSIEFIKLIIGFLIVSFLFMKSALQGGNAVFLFVPGAAGLFVLYVSGWLGVRIGRALKIDKAIEHVEKEKTLERIGGETVFTNMHMEQLLSSSFRAHVQGCMVGFLGERLGSQESSWNNAGLTNILSDQYESDRTLFDRAFIETPPSQNEYIMGYSHYGEGATRKDKGILITNFNVYLVNMQGESAVETVRSFPVEDIESFDHPYGRTTFNLLLKSGEEHCFVSMHGESAAHALYIFGSSNAQLRRGKNDEILITYPVLLENTRITISKGVKHPSWSDSFEDDILNGRYRFDSLALAYIHSNFLVEKAEKIRSLEDNEYFVFGDGLGYVLTNQCLYLFGDETFAGGDTAILLKDIESYKRKGLTSYKITIILKSGSELSFKGLDSAPKAKFVVTPIESGDRPNVVSALADVGAQKRNDELALSKLNTSCSKLLQNILPEMCFVCAPFNGEVPDDLGDWVKSNQDLMIAGILGIEASDAFDELRDRIGKEEVKTFLIPDITANEIGVDTTAPGAMLDRSLRVMTQKLSLDPEDFEYMTSVFEQDGFQRCSPIGFCFVFKK